MAYGNSPARGWIGAVAVNLCHSHQPTPQQHQIWAASVMYATVHGNARSLTQRVRPEIESASSWILVGFLIHSGTTGSPKIQFFWLVCLFSLKAAPMPYESSWARGQTRSYSCQPTAQPQQRWILSPQVTPGIEPDSLWILCQVLNPLSHNGNSLCNIS